MERKQFLRNLGACAGFAIIFPCDQGCSKNGNGDVAPEDMRPITTAIDFTINLSSNEGSGLQNNGDYILKNYVVVVKNLDGNFVAASQICSHQQTEEVRFVDKEGGIYYCSWCTV